MAAPKINKDEISKKLFMEAINAALKVCDDSVWVLSEKLGLRSHCYGWLKGNMPPYSTMQKVYFKCIEISGEGDGK